jgi:hypothetical protein
MNVLSSIEAINLTPKKKDRFGTLITNTQKHKVK